MRILFILLVVLLTSCHYLPKDEPIVVSMPVYTWVYEDEYILHADGSWCPWKVGVHECKTPLPAGDYRELSTGEYRLIGKNANSKPVPYLPSRDLCKSSLKSFNCTPNFAYSIDAPPPPPNDPMYASMWNLQKLQMNHVWKSSTGASVTVGILDTGIDHNHPDLINTPLVGCYNAITNTEGECFDDNGHGTHVAGTIAATLNNNLGVAGVSPGVNLVVAKFLAANGSGSLYNAIRGVNWLLGKQPDVVNHSWGGGPYNKPLEDAFKLTTFINVIAAGNNGQNCDIAECYPAELDIANRISVGALDSNGALAYFSNYGKDTVQIAAPGKDIISTWPGNQYRSLSGTSMAAPHVTAAIADVLGRCRSKWHDAVKCGPASIQAKLLGCAAVSKKLKGRIALRKSLRIRGCFTWQK